LKVYPDADHGFFCHERQSYNRFAAEDSWQELTRFFREHLQKHPPPLSFSQCLNELRDALPGRLHFGF